MYNYCLFPLTSEVTNNESPGSMTAVTPGWGTGRPVNGLFQKVLLHVHLQHYYCCYWIVIVMVLG